MAMLAAFACGLLFGLGLVISGMTQPDKILNFLDVAGIAKGTWDPTMAVVMVAALAVTWFGYRAARMRGAPVLAEQSFWPTRSDIDMPLIAGSVLFGIGWGLAGLCPGPALVNFVTLNAKVFVFVAAMVLGMIIHDRWWVPFSQANRDSRRTLQGAVD
jgi:uncharacterized membrane protein YedE/YeeE